MTTFTTYELTGAPAGLDCRVDHPADWVVATPPDEDVDFADPLAFKPLLVLMTQYAPVVFSVVARPAYADGTVAQWLQYAAHARNLDPGTMEQDAAGPHPAVGCWGGQQDGGLVMRVRMVQWEDGGRMIHISCMAPEPLWATFAPVFRRMLASFALRTPQGATVALAPPDLPLAPNTMVEPTPAPAPVAPPTGPLPLPGDGELDDLVTDGVPAAAVALAQDMHTFDADHQLNARLRERGAGHVPNVLDYHEQEYWATLAPAALGATLRVPFGWHVIDDGRRTLVFDAEGHTQVDLQLLPRQDRDDDAVLAATLEALHREWPTLQSERTTTAGRAGLLVRDITIDGKPVEQSYTLRQAPDGLVLRVRATASPEQFRRANDLVDVLLRHLAFPGEDAAEVTCPESSPASPV